MYRYGPVNQATLSYPRYRGPAVSRHAQHDARRPSPFSKLCPLSVRLSLPPIPKEVSQQLNMFPLGSQPGALSCSVRVTRGCKPTEPHTQGPARACFLKQSASQVRTAAPLPSLLSYPSSSCLPFRVLRGSVFGVIGALKTPRSLPPPPLPPSPPPLLSPSVCCAGTRRQMHHSAVGTRRTTACDGRTDGTVLELRPALVKTFLPQLSCVGASEVCVKRCVALWKSRSRSTPQA